MDPPLPNTYWVVPDSILAGEHPYGAQEADTRARLERLCAAGINYFIDLTEPGEMPDYRGLLPARTHYLRCAIRDADVPREIEQMQELLARVANALALGRRIYVHCRAGIGRTSVVVGCYLAEGGLDGKSALAELNRLWASCSRSKLWPMVPQTPEQAEYIHVWPAHRQSESAREPAPGLRPAATPGRPGARMGVPGTAPLRDSQQIDEATAAPRGGAAGQRRR
jgi:rhodanese/phosphatase family protein